METIGKIQNAYMLALKLYTQHPFPNIPCDPHDETGPLALAGKLGVPRKTICSIRWAMPSWSSTYGLLAKLGSR